MFLLVACSNSGVQLPEAQITKHDTTKQYTHVLYLGLPKAVCQYVLMCLCIGCAPKRFCTKRLYIRSAHVFNGNHYYYAHHVMIQQPNNPCCRHCQTNNNDEFNDTAIYMP